MQEIRDRLGRTCRRFLYLSVILVSIFASPTTWANGTLSGSWFNADRSGEGFVVQILSEDQAFVIWFTYPGPTDPPNARQSFVLGVGSFADNTITITGAYRTRGPIFGANYNKDDVVIEPWGDITVSFSDNDNGMVTYDGTDGAGSYELTRLTNLASQEQAGSFPAGISGAWSAPETNGQGWFVELLSETAILVYFFTYDENGNQAWNFQVGFVDGNKAVVPRSLAGTGTKFGDQFNKDDVSLVPILDMELEFDDCLGGTARYRTLDGAESDNLSIIRLTNLSGKECKALVLRPGDGGSIQSNSGNHDCLESQTCLVDIHGIEQLSDQFTALPRNGWSFVGWHEDPVSACMGSSETCIPVTNSGTGDATVRPIFQTEGSPYYPQKDSLMVCGYIEPNFSQSLQCGMKQFEGYGYGKLSDYTVKTTAFFVDYENRKKELEVLEESVRQEHCDIAWISDVIDFSDYVPIPPSDPNQDVNPPWPGVFEPLVLGRVQFSLLENEDAGKMIRRILLEWAENEVDLNWDLSEYHDLNGEAHYQLGLAMINYVLAWDAIRSENFVTAKDRKIIDGYLHELMTFLAQLLAREEGIVVENNFQCPYPCDFSVEVFNHAWTQDLSLMAYGVLTGNDALYQRGIRRFFAVLDGIIRPDGSHFSDSQRGGSALSYSIGSTDTLIRIAELAAGQGHDLYSVQIDGVSLHSIMDYHISVLEDETLMHPYSQSVLENPFFCEDQACADNWNNLFWSEANYHGFRKDGGWREFDQYRKRFPDSPLVDRYRLLFPDEVYFQFQSSEGPFIHSCEFRDLSE